MKPIRSILTAALALAVLSTPARAVTFQVVADTAGTPKVGAVAGKITKAAGTATTLPVTAKSSAFISFNVGSSNIDPNAVTAARLVIFFPKVTKPGNLTLFANDAPFSEVFATPTIPIPGSAGTIGGPIAVTVADSKNFRTVDVTAQVISWLTTTITDFGFGISADSPTSTVNATIGSKEGSGSGYPAVLEVDVNDGGAGTVSGSSALFDGSGVFGNGDNAALGADEDGPGLRLGFLKQVGVGPVIASASGNPIIFSQSDQDDLTSNIATSTVTERMRIDSNGRVGIGTATPQAPLDVEVHGAATGTNQIIAQFGRNSNSPEIQFNDELFTFGLTTGATMTFVSTAVAQIAGGGDIALMPTGKVGIGTITPSATLEVNGTLKAAGATFSSSITQNLNGGNFSFISSNGSGNTNAQLNLGIGSAPSNFGIIDNTNGPLEFETGGSFKMTILANGKVGIGQTNPTSAALLEVNGGIKCIGAVDTSSDARYKMNIAPIPGALDKTLHLRGVSYDWNRAAFPDKGFDDRHQLGFIAQEVRAILPDVVSEDAEGYLSIGYTAIIPVLTQAIQELKKEKDTEVAALQASNAALAQKLTALEARDQAREARLTRLEAQLAPPEATARTVSLTATETNR